MANKKENNDLTWCYLYSPGCGPCQRVTPIIEAFIATGINIKKIDVNNAPPTVRRATPSIFRMNSKDEVVGNVFTSIFLNYFVDTYRQYPSLFREDLDDPVKLLADILKSTEEGDFEKQLTKQ